MIELSFIYMLGVITYIKHSSEISIEFIFDCYSNVVKVESLTYNKFIAFKLVRASRKSIF